MEEKTWACEWIGPRGGRKWTGWVTERAARDTFDQIGEKYPAALVSKKGSSGFSISTVIEQNASKKLQGANYWLKDHLKERTRINKSITATRQKIKELEKEVKTAKE